MHDEYQIHIRDRSPGRVRLGSSEGMPKYVGARAYVMRVEGGVKIVMTDHKGTTEEIVYESIESITQNNDSSLTFTMPDGTTFTTTSLKGDKGDTGEQGPQGDKGDPGSYTAGTGIDITNGVISLDVPSGDGYDLVIEYDRRFEEAVITKGNILDLEDKLDNGAIVKGIAIVKDGWSWLPSTANTSEIAEYLPLVSFNGPYTSMAFGGVFGNTSPNVMFFRSLVINYDYETGDITNAVYEAFQK